MAPDVKTLLLQAVALHQAGRLGDAAALYDRVLLRDPKNVDALNLKGTIADSQDRREEALGLFDRALAIRASFPEAHFNRANTLAALGRDDDALAAYERAIGLRAAYADAHLNAALLLRKLNRRDAAHDAFSRMAAACPNDARAHYGLSTEDAHRGALDTAIAHMRTALRLRPDWPQALNDLGSYLNATGETDAAIVMFERSAAAGGRAYATPRINLGLAHLSRGNLGAGWDGYAQRNEDPENPYRAQPVAWPWPQWQGEDLSGKTIFVWNDQGIGDAILYASIVPEIAAQARYCIVGCDPRLVPLFQRSFPNTRVIAYLPGAPAPDIGSCDVHSALLDLGRWRRRTFSDFPNRRRFLAADPQRTAAFRDAFITNADGRAPLTGLSWRSTNPIYGAAKSLQLADLMPLLQTRSAMFFDLQYGDTRAEIAALPEDVTLHTSSAFDRFAEIDTLAAYIAALDLVITVSNTTAHLAGALGVPTWLLTPPARARLWYWFEYGAYSPWYPSAHALRLDAAGWPTVVEKLRTALRAVSAPP